MTKSTATASNVPMAELSLDALDIVMGGNSAAPMGLGGSLAAPMPALTLGAHATSSTSHGSSPTGYNDHFGLHFGGPAAAESAQTASSHSSSQSQSQSQSDSHMPMGLGGSMPSGAPVNGAAQSGAQSASGSASDAGHPASGQQDLNHGDPFAPAPIAGSAGANDHGQAHDQLGVNAGSAFQLLDEAAQDAGHEVSPEALADDHS